MAVVSMRRVISCVAPSVLAALMMVGPGVPSHSPYVIKTGTDVFGGGTGGLGSHGTSMTSSSYDTAGWGISTMIRRSRSSPRAAISDRCRVAITSAPTAMAGRSAPASAAAISAARSSPSAAPTTAAESC
jgi:hypothetical protein